ncbi:erythromycin esterase family protein [Streptosporangium sp. NPDC051022]|uniref:erythromycin esterase family protein n=1 Tax=Streptosporangium sp. NPDC051022 TaxID=3155752 RepID=UPI00342D5500
MADYLHEVDPDTLPLLEASLEIGDGFLQGSGSGAAAAPAWARLDPAEQNALPSGRGMTADLPVREIYLAESVRWHLEHAEPGTRIVVAAHNNHIRKTALEFGGAFTVLPVGLHLRRMLGQDYCSLAVTHTADSVPDVRPDQSAAVGFTLAETQLPPPAPGSVEGALIDAVLAVATVTRDESVRF